MNRNRISRSVFECAALECRRLLCAEGVFPSLNLIDSDQGSPSDANAGSVDVLTVPNYNSRGGAPRSIYLDFNGHPAIDNWGGWWEFGGTDVPATPAYDIDGDTFSFSNQEAANIRQIWKGVAEKFSPWEIDVTTVKPSKINGARVVIGGDGAWKGRGGGVGIRNQWGEEGFTDSNSGNVAFVWDGQGAAPNVSDPNYIIEAVTHEVGHILSLYHHSKAPLSDPRNEYAPGLIMGSGGRWGDTSVAGTIATRNDDGDVINEGSQSDLLKIILGPSGLGQGVSLRGDDVPNTTASATPLTFSFVSGVQEAAAQGLIHIANDVDMYRITHTGGSLDIELLGAEYGRMLDPVLTLRNSGGAVVSSSSVDNGSEPAGERIQFNQLNSGTYYIEVRGTGAYGDIGQYRLNVRAGLPTTAFNDTLSTATVLGAFGSTDPGYVAVGFGGTANINDSLASNDNYDFFRFRTPANTRQIYVRLGGLTTSAGLGLYEDGNGNGVVESGEIIFGTNPGTSVQSTTYNSAVGGRMYAVRVNKASAAAAGNYQLRITTDAAPSSLPVSVAAATFDPQPLRGGRIIYESVDAAFGDTTDYFRVTAEAAGLFSIYSYDQDFTGDLRMDVGADTNGNGVFDAGEILASSASPGSATEFIQNVPVTQGQQLLLRMTQQVAGVSNNYTLQAVADYATGGNLTGVLPGARDLTDRRAASIHEYFDASVDRFDTFRINPSTGTMTAKFVPLELGASHKLEIIRDANSNGVVDAGEIVASGFANQTVTHNVTAGATYYLRMQSVLFGEFFSTGNYRMSYATSTALTSWTTPGTAGNITIGPSLSALAGALAFDPTEALMNNTSDYFRFTLGSRQRVDLTLNTLNGGTGMNVQLGQDDGSGNFRRISWTGESNGVSANLSANLDPGTYLIRAFLPVAERQSEPAGGDYALLFKTNAVTDNAPPLVTASAFQYEIKPVGVSYTFNQDVAGSVDTSDVVIRNLADNSTWPIGQVFYDAATFRAGYGVDDSGVLPDGNYRATISAGAVRDLSANPMPGDVTLDFFVFAGDANRDRTVNLSDFAILAGRFNQPGTFSQGDFDYDRRIGIGDFSILASRFNTSLPAARTGIPPAAPSPVPAAPRGENTPTDDERGALRWSGVLV